MTTWGTKGALAAVVLGLALADPASAQTEGRTVYVDMDRVFNEFYKTKLADAQLKDQADEFKGERAKMVDQFKELQDVFKEARGAAQNSALSEEARNEKRNEAEEKLVELRELQGKISRFEESRRRQLDEQTKRVRDKLVEEIKETIATYARGQNFTAVVDASGENLNGVPAVLFYDTRNDVTQPILDLLNTGKK